jgi:hypothetical protein
MSEARILTADEIRQLPRTSIVWIEFYNAEEGETTSLMASMKCADGSLVCEDTCVFDDYEADMKPQADGYWRFWSARPTSKQREETGWPHDPS